MRTTYKDKCDIHGEFEGIAIVYGVQEIHLGCPTCNKIEEERKAKEEADMQKRFREERLSNGIRLSNIPKRYHPLLSFTPRENQKLKAWDGKQNIILIGGTGSGKTSYACHLGMKTISDGDTVRYITSSAFIAKVKNGWHDGTSEKIINEYANVDLLILDEVGRGGYDEYLFRLFDERYNNSKPTILIGNVTFTELKTVLGDAIVSRLKELGVVDMSFGTLDHRVKDAI